MSTQFHCSPQSVPPGARTRAGAGDRRRPLARRQAHARHIAGPAAEAELAGDGRVGRGEARPVGAKVGVVAGTVDACPREMRDNAIVAGGAAVSFHDARSRPKSSHARCAAAVHTCAAANVGGPHASHEARARRRHRAGRVARDAGAGDRHTRVGVRKVRVGRRRLRSAHEACEPARMRGSGRVRHLPSRRHTLGPRTNLAPCFALPTPCPALPCPLPRRTNARVGDGAPGQVAVAGTRGGRARVDLTVARVARAGDVRGIGRCLRERGQAVVQGRADTACTKRRKTPINTVRR